MNLVNMILEGYKKYSLEFKGYYYVDGDSLPEEAGRILPSQITKLFSSYPILFVQNECPCTVATAQGHSC